jgi:fructosamine-3-kinase
VTLPPRLASALATAAGGASAVDARRVGGGDINEAWSLTLDDGRQAFLKTRDGAAAGEYATEAAGLRWLAEPGALAVPQVLGVNDPPGASDATRLLLLEWIDAGALNGEGEEQLGRGLARLHQAGAIAFGAPPPGAPAGDHAVAPLRLGAVLLPNEPLPDWASFYAERRLRPLAAMATARGAVSASGVRAIEAVCGRMADLAGPPEPPARLHGDLWAGNVLGGADGRARLIDPAAHGGHREVDLAMLALFGGPGSRFRHAYREQAPLADGHEDRVSLWQLLPLLVHAVLFGGSYGASAERAARRYAG